MAANRKKVLREVAHLPWRVYGDRADPCHYCGVPSEGLDHVPPVSRVWELSDEAREEIPFLLVPACRECNSSLGDRMILPLPERRAFVRARLRKRYAKLLSRPQWDEEELADLSPELAEEIRRGEWLVAWVRARLAWIPHRR